MTSIAALLIAAVASASAQTPAPKSASKTAKSSAESAPRVAVDSAARRAPFDSALEARTSRIAAQLRCPVCQGLSIEDSPSELAVQMRNLVREQLASGKTEDEVRAFFIGRYSEWILLKPKAKGFNVLIYALPALLLIGGGMLVMILVRRWTAGGGAPDPASSLPPQD